ncbi:MAG: LD-carboxypeptidase [Candidatus Eremiobacteraeota bacterium]|nr:LD-carboxypeptidase [Candidatus Eremiobacteraeota bacterium]
MNRGYFLTSAAALAATSNASFAAFPVTMQRPPKLLAGDKVGLIAPASPPQGNDVELSVRHVEALGLRPVFGRYVDARRGYLAGSDDERAADFNAMARDPDVRAIVAIRGGYGTMRILPELDYEALRRDPKIVMGFSDFTAILDAVALRSGIITFHGPLGAHGSSWSGRARAYIETLLMHAGIPRPLAPTDAQHIASGRATGRLAGGNLSIIAGLVGTPYAIPFSDTVIFFEETEEAPYRIDRMLTQLSLAGDLRAARGFMVGQCTKCEDEEADSAASVIAQRLRETGRPALAGAPVGHIPTQWVLPIGLRVELDADAGKLVFLEPAVSER